MLCSSGFKDLSIFIVFSISNLFWVLQKKFNSAEKHWDWISVKARLKLVHNRLLQRFGASKGKNCQNDDTDYDEVTTRSADQNKELKW